MEGSSEFEPRSYWEDRLERLPGLAGVGSIEYAKSYNTWLYRVRKRVFRRIVRSLDVDISAARVLDVGSGTGFYLGGWASLGARNVTGSDLTSVAVQRLSQKFPFPIVQLDVTAGSDLGPFDIISAFDVLFHIVDDDAYAAAFATLAQLLRPGGVLIFSEHLPHGAVQRETHRVSRPLDDVLRVARDAGFTGFVRTPMFVTMEYPMDPVKGRGHVRRWRLLNRFLSNEITGFLAGCVLYPVDIILTRVAGESPTTEIVVCRRGGEAPS